MLGQLEAVCAGRESVRLSPSKQRFLFRGKPPRFLASGTRACAYATNGEVVKFTWHKPDAAAALAVAHRPVQGVLDVLDVRPVTDYHFAIRSRRVPEPGPVARLVQRCAALGHMDQAFVARMQAGSRRPAPVPRAVRACILIGGPRTGVAPAAAVKFAEELSRAQARLAAATGIHWFDVFHPGNFSQDAAGRPVIIDLGASIVPERYLTALERRRTLDGAGGVTSDGLGVAILVYALGAAAVGLAALTSRRIASGG